MITHKPKPKTLVYGMPEMRCAVCNWTMWSQVHQWRNDQIEVVCTNLRCSEGNKTRIVDLIEIVSKEVDRHGSSCD